LCGKNKFKCQNIESHKTTCKREISWYFLITKNNQFKLKENHNKIQNLDNSDILENAEQKKKKSIVQKLRQINHFGILKFIFLAQKIRFLMHQNDYFVTTYCDFL
jgi:hypothetical protein